MNDRLAGFFNQYALNARMFFTGSLCNKIEFDENMGGGFLHLVRKGSLKVYSSHHAPVTIDEPSLIFYPSPAKHLFVFDGNVDLTCAIVDLGGRANNLLIKSLPNMLLMALKDVPTLASTLSLLFAEAEQTQCARQAAIDRLFEYLIIQLLRFILDNSADSVGILAGLNDKRLAKAITAMHDNPSNAWTLELLAKQAGMSRARFAVRFRETVGTTPLDYLTQWRIGLAQTLMKKGNSISLIANEVGYSNASVFSRVFKAQVGQTPTAWLGTQQLVCPIASL
jgi:AraC-like DNA-binding protein